MKLNRSKWVVLPISALLLGLTACGKSSDVKYAQPDSPATVRALEKSNTFRVSSKFGGGIANTVVYGRADATDEELAAAGCQGYGKQQNFQRVGVAPNGVVTAHVRCSSGAVNRRATITDYPQPAHTYLTFSSPKQAGFRSGHGFQVTHFNGDGQVWLWYPGNDRPLAGEWKLEGDKICFRYSSNSYNPVTKTRGGAFKCTSLRGIQTRVISQLQGDPFRLSSGAIPYVLDKCDAPEPFRFDREEIRC